MSVAKELLTLVDHHLYSGVSDQKCTQGWYTEI